MLADKTVPTYASKSEVGKFQLSATLSDYLVFTVFIFFNFIILKYIQHKSSILTNFNVH